MQQEPAHRRALRQSFAAASYPYLLGSLWVLTKTGFKACPGEELVLPVKAWRVESQAKCLSLMTVAAFPVTPDTQASQQAPSLDS